MIYISVVATLIWLKQKSAIVKWILVSVFFVLSLSFKSTDLYLTTVSHNVETIQKPGKSPELVLIDKNNEEKEVCTYFAAIHEVD